MKYSIGLDIGTTSIGWAVVNEDKQRFEDVGVRIFEVPENPKNGESLAKPRRDARSARRRLRRRRARLDYLKDFFVNHQLLTNKEIDDVLTYDGRPHPDPYELRARGSHSQLNNSELFIALYHLAKHRGYKSNRKAAEESDPENKKVLAAIHKNQSKLSEHHGSVAAVQIELGKNTGHRRNKADDYDASFGRSDFEQEALVILRQQGWNESWINELLYQNQSPMKSVEASPLFYQRPFMTPELINRMRGQCEFEPNQPRAPKASYSFEIFRLAQDLAHLKYNHGTALTPEQIAAVVELSKKQATVKYSTLRKELGLGPEDKFDYYLHGKQSKGDDNVFVSLKFYHSIRKACQKAGVNWETYKEDTGLLDQIGEALTLNKDDEALRASLESLGLPQPLVDELLKLSFAGFGHLSFAALRKITPCLIQGSTYDKAVESVYPGQFTAKLSGHHELLPPLSESEANQITNPVVKRAITQTRKVINAIIKRYGAPAKIKLETARELAKNYQERREIKKRQEENAERNQQIICKLEELGIVNPTGTQITRYKLREQQNGVCPYCGCPIDPKQGVIDGAAYHIDHIAPFSDSGNDSLNNKVLICSSCNDKKLDHIPYEIWGKNPADWAELTRRASGMNLPRQKLDRILATERPAEDWNAHALNDTKYISRFLSNYLRQNLKFSDAETGKQKVICVSGFITDHLRKMYGIGSKNRDTNNCHHAVDACIIATVSQGQIQKISLWHKCDERGAKHHTVRIDNEDGTSYELKQDEFNHMRLELPPWENFSKEVNIRCGMAYDGDNIERLVDFRDKFRAFASYDDEFLGCIHPLFVSRMPRRSVKGRAHDATLRSPKVDAANRRLTRKKLDKEFAKNYLKNPAKSYLEASIIKQDDRRLYEQIKSRIEEFKEQAFDQPLYKNDQRFDKHGRPLRPVTTIKVYETKPESSGVKLNHHTQFADNDTMCCLDIYRRKGRFYFAPRYAHSIMRPYAPILPTPQGRKKAEKEAFMRMRNAAGEVLPKLEYGFEFVARVFPNDYIIAEDKNGKRAEGYYAGYDINTARIALLPHTRPGRKDPVPYSLSSACNIKVVHISVLGDNYDFQ